MRSLLYERHLAFHKSPWLYRSRLLIGRGGAAVSPRVGWFVEFALERIEQAGCCDIEGTGAVACFGEEGSIGLFALLDPVWSKGRGARGVRQLCRRARWRWCRHPGRNWRPPPGRGSGRARRAIAGRSPLGRLLDWWPLLTAPDPTCHRAGRERVRSNIRS
jgi:hypothetical protein